jgi:hypothetical protein
MWVYDEENGRYKVLAYIGLVVLGIAFGYAIGAKQDDDGPRVKQMYAPGGVQTYGLLTEAAEQARTEGDETAAKWYESAASAQRTRLLAWAQRDREERHLAK